jgi:sodium transport system permease protein
MSLRNIGIVYRKELLEALRDRRTLISTIVVPILLFPVLTVGIGYVAAGLIGAANREPSRVMMLSLDDSPAITQSLRAVPGLILVPPSPNYQDLISNKKIQAAVELPPGFQNTAASDLSGVSAVKIYVFAGDLKSAAAAQRIEKFFAEYRDNLVRRRLAAEKLPAGIVKPFDIQQQNVVSDEKITAETFGGIIPYLVIIMCLTGAMYPAMDLTAGEKERNTMETILSSPVSRTHLVLGKFLLVLSASLSTAALSVTSMGLSSWIIQKLQNPPAPGESAMQIKIGLPAVLSVFIVALPLAVLFSAALLTIALFAKSYKEAQSYLSPLMIVVIVPAVAAILPGVELTPWLSVIPILNVSLLCKELVAGTHHWNSIVLIFVSTSLYAAAAIFLAVKMFHRESVLFRS